MKTLSNTTFTILGFDEEGNENTLFSEVKRNTNIPFSLLCAFEGMVGQNVKFTMWTEGDIEATVLGRGGKMSLKFSNR